MLASKMLARNVELAGAIVAGEYGCYRERSAIESHEMLQRNLKSLFQFSFKREPLWILAFSLVPGILAFLLVLILKLLGLLR